MLEAEWLEQAHAIDARFHAAKLTAAAFNDPPRIWEEHDAVRRELLAPPLATTPTLTPALLQRAADLWKRARAMERRASSPTSEIH